MPEEIRTLIIDGVYSLYKISNDDRFLVVTDSQASFTMDEDGNLLEQLDLSNDLVLEKSISLTPAPNQSKELSG